MFVATNPGPARAASTFRILQLNLCNSGLAPCYHYGDAIQEAVALIDALRPNAVFFNEICRSDLPNLADNGFYRYPARHFTPVWNSSTNNNFQCTGGRGDYGSGIIVDNNYAYSNTYGRYTDQSVSNEHRVYGCALFNRFVGCTTHLTIERRIASRQCSQLTRDRLPAYVTLLGEQGIPTFVSGDLNLVYNSADPYNVQNCVPSGHSRKGDGDVQHVIVSNNITLGTVRTYGLSYTDHDGLHVTTTVPWSTAPTVHWTNKKSPKARELMSRWTVRTLTDS